MVSVARVAEVAEHPADSRRAQAERAGHARDGRAAVGRADLAERSARRTDVEAQTVDPCFAPCFALEEQAKSSRAESPATTSACSRVERVMGSLRGNEMPSDLRGRGPQGRKVNGRAS
jgi:hypothetical protein